MYQRFAICLSLLCLLSACGKPVPASAPSSAVPAPAPSSAVPMLASSSEPEPVSSAELASSNELTFEDAREERGLPEWQVHSLENQSFQPEDILKLTDAEIAEIFAPGNGYDGRELEDGELEKRVAALTPVGIDEKMYLALCGLGYTYEEMPALTKGELDFIFPNTTLFERLIAAGVMPEGSDLSSPLPEGCETYRDVIKKAYDPDPT